ncbi:MAG: hypothetical protein VX738_09620 [Planctomycetota bacterium]|nr:hypothetical protein [Planctomycetota bacterium]
MRRKAFILISLFQLLWIAGCHTSESSSPIESTATITPEKTAAEGRQDAEADIATGLLVIWQLPLPSPPWAGLLQQACEERGITLKSDSIEVVKSEYIVAYNQRMTEEIVHRHGVDVSQLDEQAYQQYEQQRQANQQDIPQ